MLDNTILHIGLDKTGSTAIQMACFANRNALLSHSIIYPGNWEHGRIGSCFYDDPTQYLFNIELGRNDPNIIQAEDRLYLDALLQEIENTQARTMVLSSEAFSFMDASAVKKMADFFWTISSNVVVLLYYREPLSYATSALSQRARTGRTLWPEAPIQQAKFVCIKFIEAFGFENIHVRKFAPGDFLGGDVRFDFFSFLGVSPDEARKSLFFEPSLNNDALSAAAILIADAIRGDQAVASMSEWQFMHKYDHLLREIKGGKLRLTKEQAESVKLASQQNTDYLFTEFGIHFSESKMREQSIEPVFGSESISSIAKLIHQLAECHSNIVNLSEIENNSSEKDVVSSDLLIKEFRLCNATDVNYGQLVTFEVDIFLARSIQNLEIGIHLYDAERKCVFATNTRLLGQLHTDVTNGTYRIIYHLIANIPAGAYAASFSFTECLSDSEKQLAKNDGLCEFKISSEESQMFSGYVYIPTQIVLIPNSNS